MPMSINKGGRPVGSTETPKALLERELRQTIKTVSNIRLQLEARLAAIEKSAAITTNLSIESQFEVMERMSNIMTALTKNIETLGKYSIGAAAGRKPVTSENDDDSTKSPDLLKILGSRR